VKSISNVTKQPIGDATSSADEDEEDADSDTAIRDDDEENKSVISAQSPRLNAASSAVKKKGEVVSLCICV